MIVFFCINADARRLAMPVLPVVFQVLMLITFQVIQFVAYFGGLMYFLSGTKTEKVMPGDASSVTLDDYKGQPVILEKARQLVKMLEGWQEMNAIGGEPPRGILLIGGPGTGKTYLARCLAGECGVPFMLLDASGLVSMWLGMGSIKVRRFFSTLKKQAQRYGACVAFLDEIDAVGAARGGVEGQAGAAGAFRGMWGGGGMGVLNTLLSCMDGLEQPPGLMGWLKKRLYGWLGEPMPGPDHTVIIMASTNRPAVLDNALTRTGRFDVQWRILPPTEAGLREVIEYYLGQVAHVPEIDVHRTASALRGSTPADIRTTVKRMAALRAVRDGRDAITESDIYAGAWETALGVEMPEPEPHEGDQRAIAYHEAGHAIAAAAVFPELRVLLATIVPHAGTGRIGASLGLVVPRLRQERQALPLDFLARRLVLSMAGREAAALATGRHGMGFGGDRQNMQAALLGLLAEGAFGYGPALTVASDPFQGPLSGLSKEVHQDIERFLDKIAGITRQVLVDNRIALDAFAELLLNQGTITAERLEEFFTTYTVVPPGSLSELFEEER